MPSEIIDRRRTAAGSLEPLFAPKHVAIVGASGNPERIGGRPLEFLRRVGFTGIVSPVNPGYTEIAGWSCYPSLDDVPGQPDLVIVAVPRAAVLDVIRQAGRRGVQGAIVFTAGFAETGGDGQTLQEELKSVALEYGIRVCGPNSVGIISEPAKGALTFASCMDSTSSLEPGNIGFISQSGAIGAFIHRECQLRGRPLRHFVGTGNEVDITLGEYLEYMVEDPGTRAVGLYIEGIREGSSLIAGLKRARELGKPVVALKVGRSKLAQDAAASHTGALTGDDTVVDAVLHQYGAIRVDDIDDLLGCLDLASSFPDLPARGGLAVISISGGVGVWSADIASRNGLVMPELAESSQAQLAEFLPDFANLRNPIDVTGQIVNEPAFLARAISVVAEDPGIDIVVVALGIQDAKAAEIAAGIVGIQRTGRMRIAVSWMAGPQEAKSALSEAGVPVFESIGGGLRAAISIAVWANRLPASAGVEKAVAELPLADESVDSEAGAKALLARIGIATPRSGRCRTEREVVALVESFGSKVVLKGQVTGVVHKSDLGLVELDIDSPEAATEAYRRMSRAAETAGLLRRGEPLSCLVEEQLENAVELILGAKQDDVFGTVIVLGLGGIQAELTRSFASRLAPLSDEDIGALITQSRAGTMLGGFRGIPVTDLRPLRETVRSFSELALSNASILSEIEINPLAVSPGDGEVVALDALMVLRSSEREGSEESEKRRTV